MSQFPRSSAEEQGYEDNFGKKIADTTTNHADISSHHPFSPERWRLFKNDTRQFVQYGNISEFTDTVDGYQINPSGGDSWRQETAKRFVYRVGYVIEVSFAFKVNQDLRANDIVTLAFGDADLNNLPSNSTDLTDASADGWILEVTESGSELNMYRNGSRKASKSVSPNRDPTILSRFAFRLNWYNVGSAQLIETFTAGGRQENPKLAEIGNDTGKGPQDGNKRMQFGVRPDTFTSNLQLEVGSVGVQYLGDVTGLNREKPVVEQGLTISNTDTWEPLSALRMDPNKRPVTGEIRNLEILKYTTNADVELVAISVDPSKTDASTWSTPEGQHAPNSSIQTTTSVSEIPNESGNQVNPDSDTKTGGFTVGDAILTTDQGSTVGGISQGIDVTRPIYDRDVIVFLGRSSSSADVTFRYLTEQEW